MKKIKVVVKTFTQEQFFGYLYLEDDIRVQDLMNDERKFIPIQKSENSRGRGNEDVFVNMVINKDSIASIEER